MAALCFESSAIVKRYATEPGTGWVRNLADPLSGNRIYVCSVAGAEVIAALARRARGGNLAPSDFASAAAKFRKDFAQQYRVSEVDEMVVARAMNLAEAHALRGYDAVQLAAAIGINQARLASALHPLLLISADVELNAAAAAEGLSTDDPNAHP